MSAELELLTMNDWQYWTPTVIPDVKQVLFNDTSQTLLETNNVGLMLGYTVACYSSLDCKRIEFVISEGTLNNIFTKFKLQDLIDAGFVGQGFNVIPSLSKFDDDTKYYQVVWIPPRPLPFRSLKIYANAPTPALDTVPYAIIYQSWLAIKWPYLPQQVSWGGRL